MLNLKLCSHLHMQNQGGYLRWSFFAKIVNDVQPLIIFAKKAPLSMFDRVLNMPLVH